MALEERQSALHELNFLMKGHPSVPPCHKDGSSLLGNFIRIVYINKEIELIRMAEGEILVLL